MKLPDALDARLRHEAARRSMTISELTREAIERHLGRRRLLAAGAVTPTSASGSRRSCGRGAQMAIVVDAGPLYAYVDADDRHHLASLELLQSHPGPLVIPPW